MIDFTILLVAAIGFLLVVFIRLQKRVSALEDKLEKNLDQLRQAQRTSEAAAYQTYKPPVTAAPVEPKPNPAAAEATKPQSITEGVSTPTEPWKVAAQNSAQENAALLARSGVEKAPKRAVPSKRYLFDADVIGAALNWARLNWFYLVAAASLGLAGVFLVQYGVETGVLSPAMRVASALVLGAVLIAFGEYLRRKGGDRADDLFAYLPSTFAAGGLLSLFAAVLSARVLYDLIGPEAALFGLALIGVLAVLIGWFYGALLAGIGILGAVLAPFLVGGDPGSANLLYYYFAVITLTAMAVDTFKRWAWLSGYAVLLAFAGAANIFAVAGGGLHFLAFGLVVTLAAAVIPERRLTPQQSGTMVLEQLVSLLSSKFQFEGETGFPTRLVAGVFAATTGAGFWVASTEGGSFWLVLSVLMILFGLSAIWMRSARALGDLVVLPMLALPGLIWLEVAIWGPVIKAWDIAAVPLDEEAAPWSVMILLGAGLVMSLVAAWRSYTGAPYRAIWALAAAVLAPLVAIVLELFWQPSRVIGADVWALHVMVVAALMVLLAERFGRKDGADHTAAAYFTLAALTMISLALILMLSAAALTLALAVMVLVATVLDRRYALPAVPVFINVGVGVMMWRLVLDPGVFWAWDAPLWEFVAIFVAVLLLLWASRLLLAQSGRRISFAVADGAFWSLAAVFGSILILRVADLYWPMKGLSHAVVSMMGIVWLVSAANQLWRLQYDELRRWIRIGLAGFYALVGLGALAVATTDVNPLFNAWEPVYGPYVLDSLFVAYALPALLFLLVAAWFSHLPNWLRYIIGGLGVFYSGLYVALEIRRFWRGDDLSVAGTTDPELYTYTVAMLLAATGLLFFAFYRHSDLLRKLALAGIGLTVAKVFLIDVSGLTGLTRVFSFLVLGLALAGLAWLDRWFGTRVSGKDTEAGDKPPSA